MYRGYYRGGPCFGFGGFLVLGAAFFIGTMVGSNRQPYWMRHSYWHQHHSGCQCPDCTRRLEYSKNYHENEDEYYKAWRHHNHHRCPRSPPPPPRDEPTDVNGGKP
ncbi:hypothetical protein G210_0972 [Candida maltosa Xu316]|uniref:Uncharacterized protein n=1 Tax=Candida maltosa (strain Xu316) TaxID=1245528 RepID=M3HU07_CANMX|nr:hypothetical protein G210_0972 [Candida maltosa Xu316]